MVSAQKTNRDIPDFKPSTLTIQELQRFRTRFFYKALDEGYTQATEDLPKNIIAMMIEGEGVVDCNEFINRQVYAGDIIFFRSHSNIKYTVTKPIKILYLTFDILLSEPEKLAVWSLRYHNAQMKPEFKKLLIHESIRHFICSSLYWFDGKQSMPQEFYEIKHQELLSLMRMHYSDVELARFFGPLLSRSPLFYELILTQWKIGMTLEDIIPHSNLSRSTFIRKFKAEFNCTPYQWRLRQNCQLLTRKAMLPGVRVKDLMLEIGIAEPSNFNKFCRTNFNCTPKEFILHYQHQSKEL